MNNDNFLMKIKKIILNLVLGLSRVCALPLCRQKLVATKGVHCLIITVMHKKLETPNTNCTDISEERKTLVCSNHAANKGKGKWIAPLYPNHYYT